MAGDKIVDCTQNGNSEKINENGDLSLSLNLEDDFIESIEYVPCPEFQFSVSQFPLYLPLFFSIILPYFVNVFASMHILMIECHDFVTKTKISNAFISIII